MLSLLLESEGVAGNHEVLEAGQLSHGIEQLFFVRHLIEGEVELFKVGEHLLAYWQVHVVRVEITRMELDKLVP